MRKFKRIKTVSIALGIAIAFFALDAYASTTFADISMSFYNKFNSSPDMPSTECFQRYHSLTLSHRAGEVEASIAYNWLDSVDSATSIHTLTPYTLDVSIPLAKGVRASLESSYVLDVDSNSPVNVTAGGTCQFTLPFGCGTAFLSPGLFAVKRDGVELKPVLGAGIDADLGSVKFKAGYDILDLKDYMLVADYTHTFSTSIEIPTWHNTRLELELGRALGSNTGQTLPVWLKTRLLFDHFLGR